MPSNRYGDAELDVKKCLFCLHVECYVFMCDWRLLLSPHVGLDCLVGLVVKASALRADVPGFKSRLQQDFFQVKSYL